MKAKPKITPELVYKSLKSGAVKKGFSKHFKLVKKDKEKAHLAESILFKIAKSADKNAFMSFISNPTLDNLCIKLNHSEMELMKGGFTWGQFCRFLFDGGINFGPDYGGPKIPEWT